MKHLVIGYHASSYFSVKSLYRGEFDLSKSCSEGWLGRALYFWEQDERQAWTWAKKQHKDDGAVLKAQLDLSDGVLDLTIRETIYGYRKFIVALEKRKVIHTDSLNREAIERFGDALWLSLYIRSFEKETGSTIKAIRAIVLTGDIAYDEVRSNGYATMTAYHPKKENDYGPESRVVTRIHIIIALLCKESITNQEILPRSQQGDSL